MARLTNKLATIDLYQGSTVQPGPYLVGQLAWDVNGKAFRYCLNGATALVAGNLVQSPVSAGTTYQNMVVAVAGKVGDTLLNVTNGTSTITGQQFQGGSISIYTAGTDLVGDEYTIVDVQGTLTTGGALKVYLDRPLRYAVTTSATVNMMPSPFSGVIVCPTTLTGVPVGIAVYAIPANQYGWVQTHGVAPYIPDGTSIVVGAMVGNSQNAAGSLGLATAGAGIAVVGMALSTAASGKGAVAVLSLD